MNGYKEHEENGYAAIKTVCSFSVFFSHLTCICIYVFFKLSIGRHYSHEYIRKSEAKCNRTAKGTENRKNNQTIPENEGKRVAKYTRKKPPQTDDKNIAFQ